MQVTEIKAKAKARKPAQANAPNADAADPG